MQYLSSSKLQYSFHYQELKTAYERYISISDEQFISELPKILHFACFVSYVKELSMEATLSDEGIVHQLVHLLVVDDPTVDIRDIRGDFETLLKLS